MFLKLFTLLVIIAESSCSRFHEDYIYYSNCEERFDECNLKIKVGGLLDFNDTLRLHGTCDSPNWITSDIPAGFHQVMIVACMDTIMKTIEFKPGEFTYIVITDNAEDRCGSEPGIVILHGKGEMTIM